MQREFLYNITIFLTLSSALVGLPAFGYYNDSDYVYAGGWGSEGAADGEFDRPVDVAVAPDGTVYVADSGNGRVQFFSPSGVLLGGWPVVNTEGGEPGGANALAVAATGNVYVGTNSQIICYGRSGTVVTSWGSLGDAEGEFDLVLGVAVGTDGIVYVADMSNWRVQYFSADGSFLGTWGRVGGGPGEFLSLIHI